MSRSPQFCHPDRSRSSRERWSAEWRDLVSGLCIRRMKRRNRRQENTSEHGHLSGCQTSPLKPKAGLNGPPATQAKSKRLVGKLAPGFNSLLRWKRNCCERRTHVFENRETWKPGLGSLAWRNNRQTHCLTRLKSTNHVGRAVESNILQSYRREA